MDKLPGATYQVLVPNEKGLQSVVSLLAAHPDKPPIDERHQGTWVCQCRDYVPVQRQGRLQARARRDEGAAGHGMLRGELGGHDRDG